MPQETKGRNSARRIKIISSLLLVVGVVVGVGSSSNNSGGLSVGAGIGGFMFLAGLIGFVVGRFME